MVLNRFRFGDNRLWVSYREHLVSPSNALFDFNDTSNHVDNNRKELLVYVHSGSIVNNRPKNSARTTPSGYFVTAPSLL